MYEGTRGSTQGERKEVAPAATASGIETLAKFKEMPPLADVLASVTGASTGAGERASSTARLTHVDLVSCRPRPAPSCRRPARTALGALALLGAALFSGYATAVASGSMPAATTAVSYRSLYLGLDHSGVSQPPLMARLRLSALAGDFPPPSKRQLDRALHGLGPALYLGIKLDRLRCPDDYLTRVTYGPGPLLTAFVVRHRLAPGEACFQLMGPVRYQVLALPLAQFPRQLRVTIAVERPGGGPGNQTSLQLP